MSSQEAAERLFVLCAMLIFAVVAQGCAGGPKTYRDKPLDSADAAVLYTPNHRIVSVDDWYMYPDDQFVVMGQCLSNNVQNRVMLPPGSHRVVLWYRHGDTCERSSPPGVMGVIALLASAACYASGSESPSHCATLGLSAKSGHQYTAAYKNSEIILIDTKEKKRFHEPKSSSPKTTSDNAKSYLFAKNNESPGHRPENSEANRRLERALRFRGTPFFDSKMERFKSSGSRSILHS